MANYVEYDTTGKQHPYHIVRPSIWPLLGAFAAGLLAVGALLFMASITLLAFNQFSSPLPEPELLILSTYFVGQWFVAMSAGSRHP